MTSIPPPGAKCAIEKSSAPPISLYRWWARRPHALIGALIESSGLLRDELISDPFSGGGTVALEAARRGYKVYAQDLNPWATWGLATAFDGVPPDLLETGVSTFLKTLKSRTEATYQAPCARHGSGQIIHTFWVRKCECDKCGKALYLFPYSLLTLASRSHGEASGFYGCSACGATSQRPVGTPNRRCGKCRKGLAEDRTPLLVKRLVQCPHCAHQVPYAHAWSEQPKWRPVLIQRLCTEHDKPALHFDIPPTGEPEPTLTVELPPALLQEIPEGDETAVLRRAGFRRWHMLYPPRQLQVLLTAAHVAREVELEEPVRSRIQLAIAGAAEMAGYLCRWDRFHPKVFEALANHRYSTLGLAVEVNPLAARGRGTLIRRLFASVKAAKWAAENIGPRTCQVLATKSADGQPGATQHDITIVSGSSSHQLLPEGTARLIITDPPYYDAVQYGELSSLFIAWAKTVRGTDQGWELNYAEEAVPNLSRRTGGDEYEHLLCRIFTETARTLSPEGKLVLTYHGTRFRGWAALGIALRRAGFRIIALGVGHSENETDHPKRNSLAFSKDLVLECALRDEFTDPRVVTTPKTSDERELLAAGRTIALHADEGILAMARWFLKHTARLKQRRIEVTGLIINGGSPHGR